MISWLWLLQNVSHNPDLIWIGFHSNSPTESHSISLRVQPARLGIISCAEGVQHPWPCKMCHIQENVTYSEEDHSYSYVFSIKNMSMEKKSRDIWCYFCISMYPKTRLDITFYLEATLAAPLRVFKVCLLVTIIQKPKETVSFLHGIKVKIKFLTSSP